MPEPPAGHAEITCGLGQNHLEDSLGSPAGHAGTTSQTCQNHVLDMPEPPPEQTRTTCRTTLYHLPRTLEPPDPLPGTTRRTRQNHLTDTPKSYLLNIPKSTAGYARMTCRTIRNHPPGMSEPPLKIGRASCRESVDLGGRRIIKKK